MRSTFAALALLSFAIDARADNPAKPLDQSPQGRAPEVSDVNPTGSFEFGSYGRVGIASDLEGRVATPLNFVSHGPRFDEDSYAELELRREDKFKQGIESRVVATLALTAPFFHFSGDVNQMFLVRNLYAQAKYKGFVAWIGSRMYRGDDIYLLDWWPLDNQNTIGGGVSYDFDKTDTRIAVHTGMQRLDDPYQYQVTQVPSPFGIGATGVESLDRPRMVQTLKLTQLFRNGRVFKKPNAGMKLTLYGEVQEIGAGVFQDPTSQQEVPLPSDWGFLVGGQVGFWTGERDTHLNMFVRYAHGLAAYDMLAVPTTFANDHTTGDSQEFLFALGGNWENAYFGILGGAYYRYFSDGSEAATSLQRYSEGTVDVRPQVYLGNYFGIALDASYQARRYAFPDPNSTTGAPLFASMWRFALMPHFSPFGKGSYKRPQFRVIYALSVPDAGFKALYPVEDFRAQRDVEHYLGLNVEWWFNSSSYP
ncbi:MAG TPA: carbohydrate porin [Polyangiaceae bacterium]